MENFIQMDLENFQKWQSKTIRLYPGINLIDGKSGSGKSTICRAIHFVLYGGKKHRNIGGKGFPKTKRTSVTYSYITPEKKYSIYRERPSESVRLELEHEGEIIVMTGKEAQSWICNEYGTEESWVASSYLAQEKDHFFIRESNADKKELLRQITFGDLSSEITPEFFTNTLTNEINSIQKRMEKITTEMNTRSFIIEDMLAKNPKIRKYGFFTAQTINKLKGELSQLEKKRDEILLNIEKGKRKQEINEKLNSVREQLNSMDVETLKIKMSDIEKFEFQEEVRKHLSGFNRKVLTMDLALLDKYLSLYNEYIRNGWTKSISLADFLDEKRSNVEAYAEYLKLKEEMNNIKSKNKIIEEQNELLKTQYLAQMSEYKRFTELKEKLKNFNVNCLVIDRTEIFEVKKLYDLYIKHGLNNFSSIDEFFEVKKSEYDRYMHQHSLALENQRLEYENKRMLDEYQKLKQHWEKQLKRKQEYDVQNAELNAQERVLEALDFYEVDETDDMSYDYIVKFIQRVEESLKELACPCCGHGLILRNGILLKGETVSEEYRQSQMELIKIAKDEIAKRKQRDDYLKRIEEFESKYKSMDLTIVEPPYPELHVINETSKFDVRPLDTFEVPKYSLDFVNDIISSYNLVNEYYEYQQIKVKDEPPIPNYKPIEKVKKLIPVPEPKLHVFEIPDVPYEEVLDLHRSVHLIEKYNAWNSNPYSHLKIEDVDIVKAQYALYNKLLHRIKRYEAEILEMGEFEHAVPEDIEKIDKSISDKKERIEIGNIAIIFQEHCEYYEQLENEQQQLSSNFEEANKVFTFIRSIANSSIDDMILTINETLEVICEKLFDTPISISLLTTKELKNGNEKNDVNLEIIYNGNLYDSANELSGGEKKRVSFALLLALMVVNTSPICIMDEVLPSMEADLKEKALEILSNFTKGKFIIHICHDVCIGHHDHVINILEDSTEDTDNQDESHE